MKTNLVIHLIAAFLLCGLGLHAEDQKPNALTRGYSASKSALHRLAVGAPESLFKADELSTSLFATYQNAESGEFFRTSKRHGKFGAGVGVQYFPKRNFGLEANWIIPRAEQLDGALFDVLTLSGIARLPVGPIAPYVKAGVGHDWEQKPLDWSVHTGGGIEVRLKKGWPGFYTEALYVHGVDGQDSALWSSGLRFSF